MIRPTMIRMLRPAAALAACIVSSAAWSATDAPAYDVAFDADARRADVRLCLQHAHSVVEFAADSAWAMRFISAAARPTGAAVDATGSGWRARDWHAGECLSYRADIGAIAAQHEPDVGWQIADDIVAAPQLWLLRPDVQGEADATLRIVLPERWNISAPWHEAPPRTPAKPDANGSEASSPAARGKALEFRIPNTPANWSSAVAFGHFSGERIVLPGGTLHLAILDDNDAAQHAKLRAWLDRVARASLSAYGRLPLTDVQVLMIPVSGSRAAVKFGQSVRGQGNALELLIDPSRPAAEFDDDWMAVHEMSHLLHPYLGDRGAWLAEGLATYYQNVLRARSGLLTPAQAWDRLYEGFQRGAATPNDETLEQVAGNMHRNHAFQRVYWAGAAYWLTVDRDLRRRAGSTLNLETVLARFRDCCLPAYREWQPDEFVARLDALAGGDVFATRYREFAQMRQFPDWAKLYSALGIRHGGDRLAFDASAADAAIRDAIMAPNRTTVEARAKD